MEDIRSRRDHWLDQLEPLDLPAQLTLFAEIERSFALTSARDEEFLDYFNTLDFLGASRDHRAIPLLIHFLSDDQQLKPVLRTLWYNYNVEELLFPKREHQQPTQVGSALLDALKKLLLNHEEANVRALAAQCLGHTPSATPILTAALKDEDSAVRSEAINAIKTLSAEATLEPLIELYANTPEHEGDIIEAIAEIRNDRALAFLTQVIDQGSDQNKAIAIAAIGDHFYDNEAGLKALVSFHKSAAVKELHLGKIAEAASRIISFSYDFDSFSEFTRNESESLLLEALQSEAVTDKSDILDAISEIELEAAVPILIKWFEEEAYNAPAEIIETLGHFSDSNEPKVLTTIIKALDHEDYSARRNAADSLEDFDLAPCMAELNTKLFNEAVPAEIRAGILIAMNSHDHTPPKSLMFDWLSNEEEALSNAVIQILVSDPDPAFYDQLITNLQSDCLDQLSVTIQALAKLQDPRTPPHLISLLEKGAPPVRRRAVQGLADHQLIENFDVMPFLQQAKQDEAESVSETAENILEAIAEGKSDGFSHWGTLHYE